MIPKEALYRNILTFTVGNVFENSGYAGKKDLNSLKQILLLMGYERSDLVENKGQFSIRGGIVDIGLTEKTGVRIEFWGDEVDSIRYFNISSQRTTEMTEKITIYPAHEYILSYNKDKEAIPEYSKIASNICNRIKEKYINTSDEIKAENLPGDSEELNVIKSLKISDKAKKRYNQT